MCERQTGVRIRVNQLGTKEVSKTCATQPHRQPSPVFGWRDLGLSSCLERLAVYKDVADADAAIFKPRGTATVVMTAVVGSRPLTQAATRYPSKAATVDQPVR